MAEYMIAHHGPAESAINATLTRRCFMRPILFVVPLLCLLVLPLQAEEALHGSWEGGFVDEEGNDVTVRLTFDADGGFTMAQEVTLGEESSR